MVYLCICIVSCDQSPTSMSLWSSPVYYEGLQDKLAQVRDARAALNALRDEHREKLRRAAEEAERQRQIQLAQKLEIMRQKKQVMKEALPSINPVLRNRFFHGCVLTAGVSGDAKAVGHPAPPGAGEGEADASGAAKAHHPDESPNARFLPALCPGTVITLYKLIQQHRRLCW